MLKMSEVDQVLIRYGDTLTLTQLSYKIEGLLTPEQCGARLSQLLETPDWMTAAQQDQLITQKMRLVIVELEERTRTDRNAEVLISALEKLGARLDKRAQATERDLTQLYAFQGTVMLEAIDEALTYMKGLITSGKQITEETWDRALEGALRMAQMTLAGYDEDAVSPAATPALEASPA